MYKLNWYIPKLEDLFLWESCYTHCIIKSSVLTVGPGPAKYLLPPTVGYEHHAPNKHRNPQYSIRGRHGMAARNVGPGTKYNIENMTQYGRSSSPAYSLHARHKPLSRVRTIKLKTKNNMILLLYSSICNTWSWSI